MSSVKNRILIDVGHARATGANGVDANGVTRNEHELCAQLATDLAAELTRHGIESTVIDYEDLSNSQDLNKTINTANELAKSDQTDYDFGVSLHMDASDNSTARGAHVCWYSETGSKIAACIAGQLVPLIPGRWATTVQRTDLAVLKRTVKPWVLVENGFITHPDDIARMLSDNKRAEIVAALVAGIKIALATAL